MKYRQIRFLAKKLRWKSCQHKKHRAHFNAYLSIAKDLYKNHGIGSVIGLQHFVAKYYIKERSLKLLNNPDNDNSNRKYFFPNIDLTYGIGLASIHRTCKNNILDKINKIEFDEEQRINIRQSNILPWAWSKHRLEQCLTTIGTDSNPWEHDDNHKINFIYPLNVEIVSSGNHSIATGILKNQGSVPVKYYSDISFLYSMLSYDGKYWHYKDKSCCTKFKASGGLEFLGILYELSRYIQSDNISPEGLINYGFSSDNEIIINNLKNNYPGLYKDWNIINNQSNILIETLRIT